MKTGQKHLIECNCILPQYKNLPKPIFHKFIVFSIIDENDEVEPKIVQCENCGIVHKIIEIGKSDILRKENITSIRNIEEIASGLPENIAGILESHNCSIPIYEEVEFILENQKWESPVIISTEHSPEGHVFGKIMIIKDQRLTPGRVKIESFTREEFLT